MLTNSWKRGRKYFLPTIGLQDFRQQSCPHQLKTKNRCQAHQGIIKLKHDEVMFPRSENPSMIWRAQREGSYEKEREARREENEGAKSVIKVSLIVLVKRLFVVIARGLIHFITYTFDDIRWCPSQLSLFFYKFVRLLLRLKFFASLRFLNSSRSSFYHHHEVANIHFITEILPYLADSSTDCSNHSLCARSGNRKPFFPSFSRIEPVQSHSIDGQFINYVVALKMSSEYQLKCIAQTSQECCVPASNSSRKPLTN